MITYPMCFNQLCFGLRGNSIVDKNFLYYLTRPKVDELKQSAHGSVFDAITKETFDNLLCLVPSLQLQQKIGKILSALDSKIELNRRINDNLEQRAQELFKSWFADFELFKGGKFMDSELGMIPEGWEVCSAKNIFEINICKIPPRKEQQWFSDVNNENIKWVSISDLGGEEIFIEDSKECLPQNYFREYTYLAFKNYDYARLGITSSIATAVNSKIIKNMQL